MPNLNRFIADLTSLEIIKFGLKIWKVHPTNPIDKENEFILSIELEERKLALLERQVKLRKEVAETEALELQNRQLKISLSLIL